MIFCRFNQTKQVRVNKLEPVFSLAIIRSWDAKEVNA